MQQLTAVDALNLHLESASIFGHISTLAIYDGRTSDGAAHGPTVRRYRERLPVLHPLRRRIVEVPFALDHPYWVEDPDLDVAEHIHQVALPEGAGHEQLLEAVAELVATPLDRSRPLWEVHVIEGLPDGRIAHLTRCHHALADGLGVLQLVLHLHDVDPDATLAADLPDLPPPGRIPSRPEMLGRGLAALATNPYQQGRRLLRIAPSMRQVAKVFGGVDEGGGRRPHVPHTPFNAEVGPRRRLATASIPLARIKEVKHARGVTVNDVVLAVCAGALRHYLSARRCLPPEPLRAMVPVNIRTEAEAEDYGNRVSGMVTPLHTDVADPVERLAAIAASTKAAKEGMGSLPPDIMVDLESLIPAVLAGRAGKLMPRALPFNVGISNVPGPPFPMYASGAELVHVFPFVPVLDMVGLSICAISYNGTVEVGLAACRDLVPDLAELAGMLDGALADLEGPG